MIIDGRSILTLKSTVYRDDHKCEEKCGAGKMGNYDVTVIQLLLTVAELELAAVSLQTAFNRRLMDLPAGNEGVGEEGTNESNSERTTAERGQTECLQGF